MIPRSPIRCQGRPSNSALSCSCVSECCSLAPSTGQAKRPWCLGGHWQRHLDEGRLGGGVRQCCRWHDWRGSTLLGLHNPSAQHRRVQAGGQCGGRQGHSWLLSRQHERCLVFLAVYATAAPAWRLLCHSAHGSGKCEADTSVLRFGDPIKMCWLDDYFKFSFLQAPRRGRRRPPGRAMYSWFDPPCCWRQ